MRIDTQYSIGDRVYVRATFCGRPGISGPFEICGISTVTKGVNTNILYAVKRDGPAKLWNETDVFRSVEHFQDMEAMFGEDGDE